MSLLESEPDFESPVEHYSTPLLSREHFSAQAEDIFATVARASDERKPLREGYAEARELYVRQEENEQLKNFSTLLLSSPTAARADKELETMRSNDNLDLTKYRELKDSVIGYNHLLQQVIFDNPHGFGREQLTGWLEMASGGNDKWARKLVAGIAAEVAVAREIQATP